MAVRTSAAERIRTLREMNAWTQSDLADASGVSQSLLSQIEQLRRDATVETLEAIARATDMPMSFFEVMPSEIPADSLHFRKNKTAPIKLTTQVKAFYRETHRIVTAVLDRASIPVATLPMADARTSIDPESIEELATLVREALKIDALAPIPNVVRAIERLGWGVFRFTLPGVEEGRVVGKGHYGLSYWGGPGERAVVGYFAGSGDRDRFTLAHEIGHCVLHARRDAGQDAEAEAHAFAGALLLPRDRMIELVNARTTLHDFARIKATFGASISATVMRSHQLGLINDTRKKSLFIQIGQNGWGKNEPVDVPNESPQLVTKALEAIWPGGDLRTASVALGVHRQVLRSIAPRRDSSPVPAGGMAAVVSLSSRQRA